MWGSVKKIHSENEKTGLCIIRYCLALKKRISEVCGTVINSFKSPNFTLDKVIEMTNSDLYSFGTSNKF